MSTITIQVRSSAKRGPTFVPAQVEAHTDPSAPLVVTTMPCKCMPAVCADPTHVAGASYAVTHLATGAAVAHVPTLTSARRVLKAVAPMADWTQGGEAIRKVDGLGERIRATVDAIAKPAWALDAAKKVAAAEREALAPKSAPAATVNPCLPTEERIRLGLGDSLRRDDVKIAVQS